MNSRIVIAIGSLAAGSCGLAWAADTPATPASPVGAASPAPLMGILEGELNYSMERLAAEDGTKPYYLGYSVYDERTVVVGATLGALVQERDDHDRNLNIDVRVGDYRLDSTHQIRGSGGGNDWGSGNVSLALTDAPDSIRQALWYHTDQVFREAAKRLERVRTDLKVMVEEEDKSDDFSREQANVFYETPATLTIDKKAWADRLRRISSLAREYPLIYNSSITLGAMNGTRYMVTSEGARLQTAERRCRITITAGTKAEDGMELSQFSDFNASTPETLPGDAEIEKAFRSVLDQVIALRSAPLAEPYIGPAILRNRASGVFFHEIFGHRVEGHRQKDVTEGQTFTKKLNEPVLPEFISVHCDPTVRTLAGLELRGYYGFDDEGVKAQRVTLVDHGVLKTFLMSRTPVDKVPQSNGHGRRQAGYAPVGRQSNLIVDSSKQVPFDELRKLMTEECKRQGKPYGLLFEDISGGYTTTTRDGPQSFKVLPIVVYRVFADGRPDELIRGADVVGTPLTSFEKIAATGDDVGVFNGSCGAESGWVPVSAASPSILVQTIEIEKRQREQSRPPILPPPLDAVTKQAPDVKPGSKESSQ
ncbi:MAG: metallopeptidase TldD-related protein [Planctomycetota bacterium]